MNSADRLRRAPRVDVSHEAVLTASDGHESPVVIRDLSAKGFRLETQDSLFVGEDVELKVGKEQAVVARILWIRGSEAGGIFLGARSIPSV